MDSQPHKDQGIIRPTRGRADPALGRDAVLAMIPSELEHLAQGLREGARGPFRMGFFDLYLAPGRGKASFALAGPFLGAPQAVMGMEKLIALGARRVWVLGWCGSLHPEVRIGDLVIPDRAFSEEGTSQHYPIGSRAPVADEALNRILREALQKKRKSFHQGPVWTTDAPYRETQAKVTAYRERGAIAVEMELSALMTLAAFRRTSISGLLVVSDELFSYKWRPGFSSPRLRRASRFAGAFLTRLVASLGD